MNAVFQWFDASAVAQWCAVAAGVVLVALPVVWRRRG